MSRNFDARLKKLETALAVREQKILVRHEHYDDDGNLESTEFPDGIATIEQGERLYSNFNVLWIVVRHVPPFMWNK